MKKKLFILLTFLPVTLLGQQLECCESEKEVETYLGGNWKMKDSDLKLQYRYEFNDGLGKFQIFKITENGTLEEIKENEPTLRVLKTEKGFEIEHDFGELTTYSDIKYLDSFKLIVTRRDGAEREYYKISE